MAVRSPGADWRSGSGSGRTRLRRDSRRGVREFEWGNSAPLPIPDVPTRSPGPPFGLGYRETTRTVTRGVNVVDNELSAVGVFGGQVKKQNPTRSARVGAAVVASVRYGDIPLAPAETTTPDPLRRSLRRPLSGGGVSICMAR